MSIRVLNPTHEGDFKSFKAAEGLKSLKEARVGIISNGKKGTFYFFNALEELLIKNHGVNKVIREVKKNYSAPAGSEILTKVKKWDAVVTGVGD